ncbi:MAG: TRAP transporter small permease subunit, partial [Bacteroidota bacterium]
QQVLKTIIQVLIGAFALIVLVIGGTYLVYSRFLLDVKSAALSIPLGYVYFVLPLSGILILYYSIDNIIQNLRNKA